MLSFPALTIFATAIGIYFGNLILRRDSLISERRRLTIVFVNSLDLQIQFIAQILFSILDTNYNKDLIDLYFLRTRDNENYKNSLKEIGIFDDLDTSLISRHEKYLTLFNTNYLSLIMMNNQILSQIAISSLQLSGLGSLCSAVVEGEATL